MFALFSLLGLFLCFIISSQLKAIVSALILPEIEGAPNNSICGTETGLMGISY